MFEDKLEILLITSTHIEVWISESVIHSADKLHPFDNTFFSGININY